MLFGTLREWSSARARKEGVPPYVLFTNRELLALVRAKPRTPNAMQRDAASALGGVACRSERTHSTMAGFAPSAARLHRGMPEAP